MIFIRKIIQFINEFFSNNIIEEKNNMSNQFFGEIFKKTMGHEGGYAFHELDRGGETYKGIARNFHKNWEGWKIVDNCKKDESNFPINLEENPGLEKSVFPFPS